MREVTRLRPTQTDDKQTIRKTTEKQQTDMQNEKDG